MVRYLFYTRTIGDLTYQSPLVPSEPRKGAYTPTESSRVQSSPVRLTKTRQWLFSLLSMAAAAVRTHQERRGESSPVQSSSVQSSPVQSYESCRVKSLDAACSIFVSQTLVVGRNGCYIEEEMDVKFVLFHDFRNKSAILITLYEFLIVN